MTRRLEILEASLEKKKSALDDKFEKHFADVKRANGQPLNDKRNGRATMDRWDRQSDSIRKQQAEVEKTEAAIEREMGKIRECDAALGEVPREIVNLVSSGLLIQWRKHPTVFFVDGVDHARIQWKNGVLVHRYTSKITDKDQWAKFRDTFNGLKRSISDRNGGA